MPNFYFKFFGLPYVYTKVKAPNKSVAQKTVSQYRSDGVCFSGSDKEISFDDLYENRFCHKPIESIQQMQDYKLKSAFDGLDTVLSFRKNQLLADLIDHFKDVPGIKNANIFTISKRMAFGLKNNTKLKDYVLKQFGFIPAEMMKKDTFIPLCLVSETKERPEENQEVALLEDSHENVEINDNPDDEIKF